MAHKFITTDFLAGRMKPRITKIFLCVSHYTGDFDTLFYNKNMVYLSTGNSVYIIIINQEPDLTYVINTYFIHQIITFNKS